MLLVYGHRKSFRRVSRGGEAMARRRKEDRRAGLAARGVGSAGVVAPPIYGHRGVPARHPDCRRVTLRSDTPDHARCWSVVCCAYSRADHEALGLGQEGGRIVRHAALGWYGLRRSPGAIWPQPPSLGLPCVRGRWASDGVGRWTGSGLAGWGGEELRGMVSPRGPPWGRGVGERPSRLQGQRPSLGQGQLPRPLCGRRRAPGQRRTPGSDDVAGRAGRAPRR